MKRESPDLLCKACLDGSGGGPLVRKVPEGHELDDVPGGEAAVGGEPPAVPVQLVHGREVVRAHAYDDDGEGQDGGGDDGRLRLLEVGDDAVGDDEEDKVVPPI